MKNYFEIFISEKNIRISEKKEIIDASIKKARSINTAVSELLEPERNFYNEIQKKLVVAGLDRFFFDVRKNMDLDKEITEKVAFEKIILHHNQIKSKITILAQFAATDQIIQYINEQREVKIEQSEIEKIHWGGDEQTEFVQLIYSMIESGYINDKDKIGKYKIVERFARFFNFPLNKNWEDNLSSSVNDRNNDYEPEIFKRITAGWTCYRDSRLEINKKNSKMKNSLRKSDLQTQFP